MVTVETVTNGFVVTTCAEGAEVLTYYPDAATAGAAVTAALTPAAASTDTAAA